MTLTTLLAVLIASFLTAVISGVFGMAGGLVLMGVLMSVTPVAIAMILHGYMQAVANFSRAALLWRHVSWKVVGFYVLGVALSLSILVLVSWRPNQTAVFFMLGVTPLVTWLPKRWVRLDAEQPVQAVVCGFLVQLLNTLAGVAGPLLDLFFVTTNMSRQPIVATKAATQVIAHVTKIAFWGSLLIGFGGSSVGSDLLPPTWFFLAVAPISIGGAWVGGRVLDRMSDVNFRKWTKWIVSLIGLVFIARGTLSLIG